MRRNRRPPSETPQEICARVRSVTAACLVDLRRLVGPDLSRAEVGEAAEAVKRMEAGCLPKMSHTLLKVNAMQHNNHFPSEPLEQVCARAVTDTADAMAALRRLLGAGASRAQLGQVAEAVTRIEVQMSSLERDLAVLLDCSDGGAGLGEALRDQSGGSDREAGRLSQMSRRLGGTPNTRAKLGGGEITLSNAVALANAYGTDWGEVLPKGTVSALGRGGASIGPVPAGVADG